MRYLTTQVLPLVLVLAAIAGMVAYWNATTLPPILITLRTAGLLP